MASSSTVHPPRILNPPADGTSLSVEEIFDVVEEWAERWPALTFVLDPNAGGEQLAQRIDAEVPNVTVATHSQRPTTMAMAAQRLSEAIATGKIRHPDDEALNAHVLAASARPVGEGWRLVKARESAAPIDAAIALAMAVSTVIGGEAEPEFATAQWPGGILRMTTATLPRPTEGGDRAAERRLPPAGGSLRRRGEAHLEARPAALRGRGWHPLRPRGLAAFHRLPALPPLQAARLSGVPRAGGASDDRAERARSAGLSASRATAPGIARRRGMTAAGGARGREAVGHSSA